MARRHLDHAAAARRLPSAACDPRRCPIPCALFSTQQPPVLRGRYRPHPDPAPLPSPCAAAAENPCIAAEHMQKCVCGNDSRGSYPYMLHANVRRAYLLSAGNAVARPSVRSCCIPFCGGCLAISCLIAVALASASASAAYCEVSWSNSSSAVAKPPGAATVLRSGTPASCC